MTVSPEPSELVGLEGLGTAGTPLDGSCIKLLNLSLIFLWFGLDHSVALWCRTLAVFWLSEDVAGTWLELGLEVLAVWLSLKYVS